MPCHPGWPIGTRPCLFDFTPALHTAVVWPARGTMLCCCLLVPIAGSRRSQAHRYRQQGASALCCQQVGLAACDLQQHAACGAVRAVPRAKFGLCSHTRGRVGDCGYSYGCSCGAVVESGGNMYEATRTRVCQNQQTAFAAGLLVDQGRMKWGAVCAFWVNAHY